MLYEIGLYSLIPSMQFSSYLYFYTNDAGLALVHNITTTIKQKWAYSALLFDI